MYHGNGVRRLETTASLDSERDGVAEVHARFTGQALLQRLAVQKLHGAIELPRHSLAEVVDHHQVGMGGARNGLRLAAERGGELGQCRVLGRD